MADYNDTPSASTDNDNWSGTDQTPTLLDFNQADTFSPTTSSYTNHTTHSVSTGPARHSDSGNQSYSGTVKPRASTKVSSEELAAQQYNTLRKFVGDSYEGEKSGLKFNDAHYKFMSLSTRQFQDATNNIIDELVRRQQSINGPRRYNVPSFLPPREGFPESYNSVRRKLGTLHPSRFRDIAMDVCYELEQRFPQFSIEALHCLDSPPNNPTNDLYGGHARDNRKLSKKNTTASSKASFIEDESDSDADDDDDDTIASYDNNSRSITSGPDLLQSTKRMTKKESKPPAEGQAEVATLRSCIEDLRSCIEELQALIKTKDEEIRRLKIEREETEAANTKRKNGGISKMFRGI